MTDQILGVLNSNATSKSQKGLLEYALGKAFEDLGNFELAMNHLDAANKLAYELKFGTQRYDATARGPFESLVSLTPDYLGKNPANEGSQSVKPIFVIGMIRSGTTLVEQILSSHSAVGAAGEQRFWLENGPAAIFANGARIEMEALGRLSVRYAKLLAGISPEREYVVDKMPQNYLALGLIHLAFPNARFIHIKRHPIDTCLSIYATPNRNRLRWAHNKMNIAIAYEQYLATMESWRQILPDGVMLEIDYEELTRSPEASIRSLIAFCGLEWDEACLKPERNERSVVTPSVWQVRQPIYRTSVARWKNFEPWLGEFARLKV